MTIRAQLLKEFQRAFEERIDLMDAARQTKNEREFHRNRGFLVALNDAIKMIDALQDSDTIFVAIHTIIFDAFRVRGSELSGLAGDYEQNNMPLDSARAWGTATGYELAAAIIRTKADTYLSRRTGLE